mmetsp:Transcript_51032/g.110725  ORF Transcript_51032/g.110725 Transcript_51032/m.110725 type:complete len:291 (-) Transcript_51032:172-1044(-)
MSKALKEFDDDSLAVLAKKSSLYMGTVESMLNSDIIEVLRTAAMTNSRSQNTRPGTSDEARQVRDLMAADPYSMDLIAALGLIYSMEGRWSMSANVLIRGWKRVMEIKDRRARFIYLMKLCQASLREGKVRQALAVFQDMEEPEDRDELKSYLILSCHVYAGNNDLPKALKVFSRAVTGESFKYAARVLAATALCLHQAGGFAAAKSIVDAMKPTDMPCSCTEITTVEHYVETLSSSKNGSSRSALQPAVPRWCFTVLGILTMILLVLFLYWLETSSLRSWGFAPAKAKH